MASWNVSICSHWLIAIVFICLSANFIDAEIRLGGGSNPTEGRLEVAYENSIQPGMWSSVCGGDGWTLSEATVVCRELGHPGPAVPVGDAGEKYGDSYLNVLLTNVKCKPEATNLLQCKNTTSNVRPCTNDQEAGVVCQKPGYVGCYKMKKPSVEGDVKMTDANMTMDMCLTFCKNASVQMAGVANEDCHCWAKMPNTTTDVQELGDHLCDRTCAGNPFQICGGEPVELKTFIIYDTEVGFCNDPGVPGNGFRDSDWFRFGATLTYTCNEGFQMQGLPTLECVQSADGYDWNDLTPHCARILEPTFPSTTTRRPGTTKYFDDEEEIAAISVGVAGGGVAILLFLVMICVLVACCKSRVKKKKKKKEKQLLQDGGEEAQENKSKAKKSKKKSKKVKKKNRETEQEEKERDEREMETDGEKEEDEEEEDAKDEEDDDPMTSENKANAKLDTGPIATADHSYYQIELDQSGKNKNKPLPSARGMGRPTTSNKPAKFEFVETDRQKSSKRGRGMVKNVLYIPGNRGKGNDDASDVLLKDP